MGRHWALYLDESGTPERHTLPLPRGTSPLFTLAGAILPLDRWREFDRGYLALKRRFFRAEIDKSSKDDTSWEIKGSDLIAPRNKDSERNKVFTYRVLDLIKSYEGCVVGVTFLKSLKNPLAPTSMYTKALQIIAERFDVFLREVDGTGMMIVDSRMAHTRRGSGLDYTVAKSYLSFVFGNEEGRQLKRIIEAPLFVDSQLTAGIQIADIVAALVYGNHYRERLAPHGPDEGFGYLDYRHTHRYWRPLKNAIFESTNVYHEGKTLFGLRVIDHRDGPVSTADLQRVADRFAKA